MNSRILDSSLQTAGCHPVLPLYYMYNCRLLHGFFYLKISLVSTLELFWFQHENDKYCLSGKGLAYIARKHCHLRSLRGCPRSGFGTDFSWPCRWSARWQSPAATRGSWEGSEKNMLGPMAFVSQSLAHTGPGPKSQNSQKCPSACEIPELIFQFFRKIDSARRGFGGRPLIRSLDLYVQHSALQVQHPGRTSSRSGTGLWFFVVECGEVGQEQACIAAYANEKSHVIIQLDPKGRYVPAKNKTPEEKAFVLGRRISKIVELYGNFECNIGEENGDKDTETGVVYRSWSKIIIIIKINKY